MHALVLIALFLVACSPKFRQVDQSPTDAGEPEIAALSSSEASDRAVEWEKHLARKKLDAPVTTADVRLFKNAASSGAFDKARYLSMPEIAAVDSRDCNSSQSESPGTDRFENAIVRFPELLTTVDDGETVIFTLVRRDLFDAVARALNHNAQLLQFRTSDQRSPLSEVRSSRMVDAIFEYTSPESWSEKSASGVVPLLEITKLATPEAAGNLVERLCLYSPSIIERLTKRKAHHLNVQDELGRSALHFAVLRRDVSIVAALASCDQVLPEVDEGGNGPLHYAASQGDFAMAAPILIQPRFRLITSTINSSGHRAVDIAQLCGNEEAVDRLVSLDPHAWPRGKADPQSCQNFAVQIAR